MNRNLLVTVATVSLVAMAAACGGNDVVAVDGGPLADGGSPDGAIDGAIRGLVDDPVIAAASPPRAPDFGTCPTGWREVDADGATVCEPWPEVGRRTCPVGSAHFLGEAGCAPVGAPCGPEPWPATLPSGSPALFVAPGGTGDGSRAAPFGTIAEALATAPVGAVVALASGSYDEALVIDEDVTIVGACVTQTSIVQTTVPLTSTFTVTSGRLTLRGVSIGGTHYGVHADGGTADLDGVWLEGSTEAALYATNGGNIEAREVMARRTVEHDAAAALQLDGGGTANITRAVFEELGQAAVIAIEDSQLTLTSVLVRSVSPELDSGANGIGVYVVDSIARLDSVVIEDTHAAALVAAPGATIHGEQVLLRGVSRGNATKGIGILANAGASLTLAKLRIEDVEGQGMYMHTGNMGRPAEPGGPGVTAEMSDVVIRDVFDPAAGGSSSDGGGIAVAGEGAHLVLDRALIVRIFLAGVSFGSATGVLTDVTVRDPSGGSATAGVGVFRGSAELTRVQVEGSPLFGIYALAEASIIARDLRISGTPSTPGILPVSLALSGAAVVERVLIEDVVGYGLLVPRVTICNDLDECVVEDDSDVVLTDLLVDGVNSIATDEGDIGRAVGVLGGRLELTRARLRDMHETAVQVRHPGSSLILRDAVIEEIDSSNGDRVRGHGIVIVEGASADLERVKLRRAREVGVLIEGEGSHLESRLVEVLETRPSDCDTSDCAGGVGLSVRAGGTARVSEFAIDGNSLVGVQLLEGGQLDLEGGEVSRSPIGANVQDESFDIGRLTRNVHYFDNGTNLDALGLPVPAAGPEGALVF